MSLVAFESLPARPTLGRDRVPRHALRHLAMSRAQAGDRVSCEQAGEQLFCLSRLAQILAIP